MTRETITGDMRVWNVINEHPETFDVFRVHGCPDMRHGLFNLSAHLMKVKWAAKMHHIPADELLRDLNRAVQGEARFEKETPSMH